MIVPLFVGREKSIRALEEVMKADKHILLATQMNAADDDPAPDAIYDDRHARQRAAAAEAARRHREGAGRGREPRQGHAATPAPTTIYEAEAEALADELGEQDRGRGAGALGRVRVRELCEAQQEDLARGRGGRRRRSTTTRKLADTIASHLAVKIPDKQEILEIAVGRQAPREGASALMESEISVLQVEKRIRTRVKRQMEKTQREYYLNEQMKAIQKELGDEDGKRRAGRARGAHQEDQALQGSARARRWRELKKLRQMSPMSAEATVVRNYLDWLLGIPWGKRSKVKKDLGSRRGRARRRSFRPRQGQGADRRVPRRAERAEQADRPDPVPRRPSRRRQDLARQVDRQGDRPRVRAHVARRRARRGGDPRPPAHLYRLDARQDHPVDAQGEDVEPALPARRDRQDGHGFPRRSVVGAARGARSRAELDVQRPLSRGRLRPVERDVRDDGEHAQHPAGR